jgi:hypothetical protein
VSLEIHIEQTSILFHSDSDYDQRAILRHQVSGEGNSARREVGNHFARVTIRTTREVLLDLATIGFTLLAMQGVLTSMVDERVHCECDRDWGVACFLINA